MLSHACEDMIGEIIERLPIKSLIRFRSVSKSWCFRITSRVLILMQTAKHYHIGYNEFEDIYILHSEDNKTGVKFLRETKFVGSCNAIVCLRDLIDGERYIFVLNFSVTRPLTLHYHPSLKDCIPTPKVAYGFGFDTITLDYKIVGICYSYSKGTLHGAFIYSITTNSWTEITPPSTPFYDVKSSACFVNGTLYWLVKRHTTKSLTEPKCFIITFNLNTHVFGTILLPFPFVWETTEVTIYNSTLALIYKEGDNATILVMIEYNDVACWCEFFKSKMDRRDIVKVLQPISMADLSFNTYTNGLKRMQVGPYSCSIDTKTCVKVALLDGPATYGEIFSGEKTDKHNIIRLSMSTFPFC